MTDTPETDALREAIDNGAATEAEMTSLAGKLERECSKAYEALRFIAYDCNNPRADYQAVADAALVDIESMRRELK